MNQICHNDKELLQYIKKQKLNSKTIFNHFEKIKSQLENPESENSFLIKETCRKDNHRLFPLNIISKEIITSLKTSSTISSTSSSTIAFIPAAGAASRYFKPLEKLFLAIKEKNKLKVKELLKEAIAKEYALPKIAKDFLTDSSISLKKLEKCFQKPKGLQPCSSSGKTFFESKTEEHDSIASISGQVFAVPPKNKKDFQILSEEIKFQKELLLIPQGKKLSTIRVNENGKAILVDSELSLVPAGHGTLTKLFDPVIKHFPEAKSILIRNVDNVSGTQLEVVKSIEDFLALHSFLLYSIDEIRNLLIKKHIEQANQKASELYVFFPKRQLTDIENKFIQSQKHTNHLWQLIVGVFQTPLQNISNSRKQIKSLMSLFQRPFNTMGMVANNGKDVGGSPVIIEKDGLEVAICLELPHVKKEQMEIMTNPKKATHFNPVFVAAELRNSKEYIKGDDFWILSKKTFSGQTVYYHETVLYEILSNSLLMNTIFIEIPRGLFCPHKEVSDTAVFR